MGAPAESRLSAAIFVSSRVVHATMGASLPGLLAMSPDLPTNTVRKNVWRASLREEPFRLFFATGIGFGLLGAGHWLLYGVGITGSYSGFVHGSIQIQGFMASFIFGFLFTAWPKFTVGPVASRWELAAMLFGAALFLVGVGSGAWRWMEIGTLIQLVVFGVFMGRRYWFRATQQPPVLIFLFVAFVHAVAGAGLLLWIRSGGPPSLELLGRRLLWQGSCLAVVLGMGGHLIPRVLAMPEGVTEKLPARPGWSGLSHAFHGWQAWRCWLSGTALFASFLVEHGGGESAGRLLRAVVVSANLVASTQVWRLPRLRATFAYGLWASVWLVAIGVWVAALTTRYHVAALHLVFIGGFSLLVLTVGARVTLSHGGYMRLEPRNRTMAWVVACVVAALVLRLAADTTPEHYFTAVAAAAGLWMVACLLWAAYFIPKMVYREFPVVRPARSLRVVPPARPVP
jgi:uncharacterized protein involved in response to NO